MTITVIDHPEEVVRAWLASTVFGSLHPIAVTVARDIDFGDRESWFFEVVLPDPPPGEDTWSVEDIFDLQRQMRDVALDVGLTWPWYTAFKPETDDEPEELELEDRT